MMALTDTQAALPANPYVQAASMTDEQRQALAFQMSQNMVTQHQVAARDQRIADVEAQAQMMMRAAANLRAAADGADGLQQLRKTVHFVAAEDGPNGPLSLYVLNQNVLTELVDGVHIDRILNCEALCVGRPGLQQFVPADVLETCDNVNIALGSPDACNVSSITFRFGRRYVLCDTYSIERCSNLHRTNEMNLTSNNNYDDRNELITRFLDVALHA